MEKPLVLDGIGGMRLQDIAGLGVDFVRLEALQHVAQHVTDMLREGYPEVYPNNGVFSFIPDEVVSEIFQFLSSLDLSSIALVCRRFRNIRDEAQVHLIRKNARPGVEKSREKLNLIEASGCKNVLAAFEHRLRDAEGGDARAMRDVGYAYFYGIGCPQSQIKAYEWCDKARIGGDIDARNFMAVRTLHGQYGTQNREEAFKIFSECAEYQLPIAMFNAGCCHEHGWGTPRNSKLAIEAYHRAAEQGLAMAECALGIRYIEGHMVQRDIDLGRMFLQQAAEKGDEEAVRRLGLYRSLWAAPSS